MKRDRDLADIRMKLEELREKAGDEVQELVDDLEARLDGLQATIAEEMAELKEVGLIRWVQLNPRKAMLVAAVVGAVLLVLGNLVM